MNVPLLLALAQAAHLIRLWLSGVRAKQGMRPLLAHEVRACLVCGEAVLEVYQEQAASYLLYLRRPAAAYDRGCLFGTNLPVIKHPLRM
jgi:hypothetical protein